MTDEELIRLLRDQRDYKCDLAADRIEGLNAKLAKATDVLREILFTSNEDDVGGWLDALARGQALMEELEKTK
jgi:hypothetical protein